MVYPDVISKIRSNIITSMTVWKIRHRYNMWNVMIENSGKNWTEVFMYEPKTNTSSLIDTANAFYTTIGCGIAYWTTTKINGPDKLSPLSHESGDLNYDGYTPDLEN